MSRNKKPKAKTQYFTAKTLRIFTTRAEHRIKTKNKRGPLLNRNGGRESGKCSTPYQDSTMAGRKCTCSTDLERGGLGLGAAGPEELHCSWGKSDAPRR